MNSHRKSTAKSSDGLNENGAAEIPRQEITAPVLKGGSVRYVESLLSLQGDKQLTRTLPHQICELIIERIITGELMPGSRLTEQQFVAEFNVSHGPVREAMRLLAAEGMVEIQPYRGAVVTKLTRREIKDIFDIRAELWGLAVRRACEASNPEVIALVRQTAEAIKTVHGGERLVVAERTMGEVARSSGNERLCTMLRQSALQIYRYIIMVYEGAGRTDESARQWDLFADAMERRDVKAAEEIFESMIKANRDAILTSVDDF